LNENLQIYASKFRFYLFPLFETHYFILLFIFSLIVPFIFKQRVHSACKTRIQVARELELLQSKRQLYSMRVELNTKKLLIIEYLN